MSKLPWYDDGLQFGCVGCGRCCRGPGGYVWITPDEAWALADALGMTGEQFAAKMVRMTPEGLALVDSAGGDCPLLDEQGHCKAYNARPLQCRTWPWWAENLTSRARWDAAAARCPGMNQGELHSRVYIDSEMSKEF